MTLPIGELEREGVDGNAAVVGVGGLVSSVAKDGAGSDSDSGILSKLVSAWEWVDWVESRREDRRSRSLSASESLSLSISFPGKNRSSSSI